MSTQKQCYRCGENNPDQAYCGSCGSPLTLNDFISVTVKEQLASTMRDRSVIETESSIKVFTQAWGWMKLVLGIAAVILVLGGAGVFWKASDFWSGVDKAKQSVTDTATKSSGDIEHASSQAKQEISNALDSGKTAITVASNDALQQSHRMKETAAQSKTEISRETAAFRSDLEGSRQQLQAASRLQPEMEGMQKTLAQATEDIQAQQKVISSSEDFVKSVFSSHMVEYFLYGQSPEERYQVILPPKGGNRTVVMFLLEAAPIPQTLQLQYHIYTEPPNSYFCFQNLVIFFWSDPPNNLKAQVMSASYFPDKSQKDIIHALTEHDGRIYADDQPLPKFNQPDPDFKGNKWPGFPRQQF